MLGLSDDPIEDHSTPQGNRTTQKHKQVERIVDTNDSSNNQDKIKVAFAEGYLSRQGDEFRKQSSKRNGDQHSKSPFRRFLRNILLYGGIAYVVVFLLNAAGIRSNISLSLLPQFEVVPDEVDVSFKDVKGVDEAKQELRDVVNFLRDPERFTRLGARLPKGVLLVGPPGTGKTLLARAVAGEAEVPFFHASGSEFDEMFVGTGARRLRSLFASAKSKAPCVVFIDEIDSVGAKRTNSQLHPYANQTINQLLAEMDGFEKNEGIMVLAATNRRDNLDSALLRPGRFDVVVSVSPPDVKGRKEIFDLYLSKVISDTRIDSHQLALATTGFTGADIENMVNQASLRAAQRNSHVVNMNHLEWAKDKILMGPAKLGRIIDKETNETTAVHEAGHTIVSYFTNQAHPLHKVTIIPRGQALGFTASVPKKDYYNRTKVELLAEMDVCMGGRVAEELVFGIDKISTGAESDFVKATAIATAMVKKLGMSDKVGVRVFRDAESDLGLSTLSVNEISPALQETIDSEIHRLLQESYERAKKLIQSKIRELKAVAKALLDVETLSADDVKKVIENSVL